MAIFSARIAEKIANADPSRTIDHASGWHDQKIGDTKSLHVYFKKYDFKPDKLGRAVLLSEFGGYNLRCAGHSFSEKDFGYKKFKSEKELIKALEELYGRQIKPPLRAEYERSFIKNLQFVHNFFVDTEMLV